MVRPAELTASVNKYRTYLQVAPAIVDRFSGTSKQPKKVISAERQSNQKVDARAYGAEGVSDVGDHQENRR